MFVIDLPVSSALFEYTKKGSFVYDDSEMVLENRNVTGKTTLYQLFFDKQVMTFSGEIYRPLRDVSYRVDYLIGGREPYAYHAANIILHVFAALIVYWFLVLLFKGGPVSLLAAALFAVHPLHTESVAWIKGRDDILFTLFYLLSFIMYLKHESIGGWKEKIYFLTSLFLYILSLFSKELAVTLPLTIALYQVIFKRLKFSTLLPFFVISAMYMGLRTYVLGQVAQQEEYWGGSFLITMLTMIKGVAQYVRLSFLPINQCADYLFPISTWIDSGVILSVFLLAACFIFLFCRDRLTMWGGLFFFVSLLPVLNIVPIKIVIAERFLYLPLVGFCIVFASALSKIFINRNTFRIIGGLITLFLTLTIQRNYVWGNEYSLWSDTIKKSPDNPRAHYGLGTAYASKGMMDEAVKEYKKAIELAPYYPYAFNALGLAYYKKGTEDGSDKKMVDAAAKLYIEALKLDPTLRDARHNLALLYHEQGRMEDAIKEYNELLRYKPADLDTLNSLGLAFFQKGFFVKALSLYRKTLDIDPESVAPYNNIGKVYAVKGQQVDAEKWFKKGLIIDPESAETYYNLGYLYQNMGRQTEAAEAYKKAIGIKPDYKEAREKLSEIK